MLLLVFACSAVLAASPAGDRLEDVSAQYQAARSAAGRDADAHVRLALWCETRGMTAERLKHLAIAVMTDPAHPTARGLLGLVDYRGKWQRPEAVAAAVRDDAALAASLADYNGKREALGPAAKAADHFRLAVWCAEAGLDAESVAHLTITTRLDPNHEAAWKRLGCKKRDGRWISDAQLAAEKREADAQRAADRRHRADLLGIRDRLDDRDPARRSEARAQLDALTDPRAVPSVRAVFGFGKPAYQTIAVQLLGQIDAPAATRTLVELALKTDSAEVRRLATETLKRKDVRDHLASVIGLIRKPLRYEVRPVDGPGSVGVLFVEGERYNVRRTYSPPALPGMSPEVNLLIAQTLGLIPPEDSDANPMNLIANFAAHASPRITNSATDSAQWRAARDQAKRDLERQRRDLVNLEEGLIAAQSAQQQLEGDVRSVEAENATIGAINISATSLLRELTQQDFGDDREKWTAWETDQRGYAYRAPVPQPLPTFTTDVLPQFTPLYARRTSNSCFAAGTPVHTLFGLRPIESLQIGDRILSQDPANGALAYEPIVAVLFNPPNRVIRITAGADSVAATGIHRFWKVGVGWTMARELKPGDEIRTVEGKTKVGSVEAEGTVPVFNVEVARGASFFVGQAGALVHDNSTVKATPEPFDAATLPLASAKR